MKRVEEEKENDDDDINDDDDDDDNLLSHYLRSEAHALQSIQECHEKADEKYRPHYCEMLKGTSPYDTLASLADYCKIKWLEI